MASYYTIVVSRAANRPANARAECGVAWLPAGPLDRSVMIYRHMLPSPDFAEAIQNLELGDERAGLGEYYPVGEYLGAAADFEARGCPAPHVDRGPGEGLDHASGGEILGRVLDAIT